MVKPTPNASIFVCTAGFSVLLATLVLVIAHSVVSGGLGSPRDQWGFFPVALLGFGVLSVLMAIASAWGARFWWRLERRRQTAALGDEVHTFPVVEPPSISARPLLPATISVRMKPGAKLVVWACAVLMVAIASGEALDHGVWDLRFFTTLLGAVGSFSFLVPLHTGERRIEVTDGWLAAGVGPFQEIVPWEEARLFALTRGRHATLTYELASATASAPWMWLRPDAFSARLFEPTIPQYEYDRQMEALLALIAAKTGLPLYDLR